MTDPLAPPEPFTSPLVQCPACGHGIDPHGTVPGGTCDVGTYIADGDEVSLCQCLWSPNDIAAHLLVPLVKALKFYADPATYHAVGFWFDPPCGGFDEDFSADHGDEFYQREMPGKTAREALAVIQGENP